MKTLQQQATEARIKVLELIYKAQTSHIGSNFSVIDILTVLFNKIDLEKDKVILSAGWKAAALYYFWWTKGKITDEELNSYCMPGSKFIGLAEPVIPEIPFAGGSMGYGLPAGVGFALAKKLKGEDGKIYVIMSDGEIQCGTTWESMLIARQHNLDNLCVLVDKNDFQAMGKTDDILELRQIKQDMCGWDILGWPGHDYEKIEQALSSRKDNFGENVPNMNFFNTIKGKGVSFMENNTLFHYKAPNEEEYKKALNELLGL